MLWEAVAQGTTNVNTYGVRVCFEFTLDENTYLAATIEMIATADAGMKSSKACS